MTRQQTTTRKRPRSKKTDADVFDEANYRAELVKIGIDLESATLVAAKTAQAPRDNAAKRQQTAVPTVGGIIGSASSYGPPQGERRSHGQGRGAARTAGRSRGEPPCRCR